MNEKTWLRKALVLASIFLFVGAGVIPSLGGTVIDKKSNHPISKGKTLYVGGTGPLNYTWIQTAIRDASDGDTVYVYDDSSPYYEEVEVDKSINLIGEDKDTTVIIRPFHGIDIIYVNADWVNISGFTIKNGNHGIDTSSNYNTITGNIISNNYDGIHLDSSIYNTIEGNNISKNKRGIYLGFSNRNTIQKNNFIDNEQDVYFWNNFRNMFLQLFMRNRFKQNYWDRAQVLPKLIRGEFYVWIPPFANVLIFPWISIDWRPALKPYDL